MCVGSGDDALDRSRRFWRGPKTQFSLSRITRTVDNSVGLTVEARQIVLC